MDYSALIFEEKVNKYISYLESIGYNNLHCKKEKCFFIEFGYGSEHDCSMYMCFCNESYQINIIDKTINSKQKIKIFEDKYNDSIVTNKDGYFMIISNSNRVN